MSHSDLFPRASTLASRLVGFFIILLLGLSLYFALCVLATTTEHAQPGLIQLANLYPERDLNVIVQTAGNIEQVESFIFERGGTITRSLDLLNAFAASLKGKDIASLIRAEGVTWVSLDTQVIPRLTERNSSFIIIRLNRLTNNGECDFGALRLGTSNRETWVECNAKTAVSIELQRMHSERKRTASSNWNSPSRVCNPRPNKQEPCSSC